jgi:hypothetical protein
VRRRPPRRWRAKPPAGAAAPGAAAAAPAPPARRGLVRGTASAPVAALPAPRVGIAAVDAKAASDASFWSGNFRTATGDSFLALQFYLPADKPALAAPALHFGGVVTNDAGQEVGSYWEEATFTEIAEGTRKDRVVDKSIVLPPGKYKGSFGLFAVESQPPVAASTVSFQLPEKSTEFEVSPLLLSNGIIPLTKRPGPADPFVFGSDKPMKFDPKGDRHFPRATASGISTPSRTWPAGSDRRRRASKPRIMTRINVQLEGKDAFAPFTGPADLQEVAPGYYVTGSEIRSPRSSGLLLVPGEGPGPERGGQLAGEQGIDRQQDSSCLMPDGACRPRRPRRRLPRRPKEDGSVTASPRADERWRRRDVSARAARRRRGRRRDQLAVARIREPEPVRRQIRSEARRRTRPAGSPSPSPSCR